MKVTLTQEEIMKCCADKILSMTGHNVSWEDLIFEVIDEEKNRVTYESVEIYAENIG